MKLSARRPETQKLSNVGMRNPETAPATSFSLSHLLIARVLFRKKHSCRPHPLECGLISHVLGGSPSSRVMKTLGARVKQTFCTFVWSYTYLGSVVPTSRASGRIEDSINLLAHRLRCVSMRSSKPSTPICSGRQSRRAAYTYEKTFDVRVDDLEAFCVFWQLFFDFFGPDEQRL